MVRVALVSRAGREGWRRRARQDEGRYAASPLLRPSPLPEMSCGGRSGSARSVRSASRASSASSGQRGLGGGSASWPTGGPANHLRVGSLSVGSNTSSNTSSDTGRRVPSIARCGGGGVGGGGGGSCQAVGPGRGEGVSNERQHGHGRRRGGEWRHRRVMRRTRQRGGRLVT